MSEATDKTFPANPAAEVAAMGKVAEAVAGLESEAIGRVLKWAIDVFGVAIADRRSPARQPGNSHAVTRDEGNGNNGGGCLQFSDLADLYAATNPESEADKTLVAAYWAQFGEGKSEFTSMEINSALKNLGHPIKNITSAFDNLKARKPAPVMQLKKSGSAKQARKTYKLTIAGKSVVEAMVSQT